MHKWIKGGRIFKPKGEQSWMQCFTCPIAAVSRGNRIRIYFSTRSWPDKNNNYVSEATFIDVNSQNLKIIEYVHNDPIIQRGGAGHFDEFGVMVAKPWVVDETHVYLYYMGWQRLCGQTAPYQVALGLAESDDGGTTFKKISNGPIIGMDNVDPVSIGNVSVLVEHGIWKMWYTSYIKWAFGGIKPTPEYNIKYAESRDGIKWNKKNIICIECDSRGGVATPSVIKMNDEYHMWYGYRPPYDCKGNIHGYRIGYAVSSDGIIWRRKDDESGIEVSSSGWDSEMICYPHIIKNNDKHVMFYCGNGFGKTGFGYAVME